MAPDALDAAVEAEVAAVLQCAPGAAAHAKALAKHLARNPADSLVAYSIEQLADRWESEEAKAGIEAFLARRSAPWT